MHAIRSDETNCELTAPLILARPALIGPVILRGGLPGWLMYSPLAPSCVSASTSGPIGRLTRLASPVSVVVDGRSDAIPVMIRMVVPEFFASMVPLARFSPPDVIVSSPAVSLTSAPNAFSASSVAFVSSEMRGRLRVNSERVSAPSTIALWVYDLDGGAVTDPFATDDLITIAVGPPSSPVCR